MTQAAGWQQLLVQNIRSKLCFFSVSLLVYVARVLNPRMRRYAALAAKGQTHICGGVSSSTDLQNKHLVARQRRETGCIIVVLY